MAREFDIMALEIDHSILRFIAETDDNFLCEISRVLNDFIANIEKCQRNSLHVRVCVNRAEPET